MSEVDVERMLRYISKAWGKQSGYAFFPWIGGQTKNRQERIESYREGPAFLWPRDREKIIEHMQKHITDDLYWCPSLFERPRRQMEVAMDEHALWADLDEVHPEAIDDALRPSIAWETSPGRYQALWIITKGDVQGASWRGGENQRLSHYIGADPSGWDTTQLLRIPGWRNFKWEYQQKYGEPVQGKLMWIDGPRYFPTDFEELPEVHDTNAGIELILEDQIEAVDVKAVWGRVRLRVSKAVREAMAARDTAGADRSTKLWEIERELADAGCTAVEIVAIIRESVWNKYHGRQDELKRLTVEAGKAIAARAPEVEAAIEAEREDKPDLEDFITLVNNAPTPRWLVKDIWTEGGVGFIAGQPKSWKSWIGLDLAFSVATGMPFLNWFRVLHPGPVLYIQEEDSASTLRDRKNKVWPGKMADRMTIDEKGDVYWLPATDANEQDILMKALISGGFIISDEGWQAWLDEQLGKGYNGNGTPYAMVLLDPMLMMLGDVDENRAADMTRKVFRPLKELARKHRVAIALVHHMRKQNERDSGTRGGQLLLGSVANHAWAEDSLYVKRLRRTLAIEQESKSGPSSEFVIHNIRTRTWEPAVEVKREEEEESGQRSRPARQRNVGVVESYLRDRGSATSGELTDATNLSRSGVYQQLKRLASKNMIEKRGAKWFWIVQ